MFRIILAIILSGMLLPVFAETASVPALHILALADIHFDPFIGCHHQQPCPLIQKLRAASPAEWEAILKKDDTAKPQFREDTTYTLYASAIASAKQAALTQKADFALILGDFLGHNYRAWYKVSVRDYTPSNYHQFVRKTLAYLSLSLAKALNIDVYPVLGNNDSYNGDYVTGLHSGFFNDTAQSFAQLIKSPAQRRTMQRGFAKAGYYAIRLPQNISLIVLNTNLFSYKARGKGVEQAAQVELNWLHQQLEIAKLAQQKVIIAMHIPMSIDIYSSKRVRLFRLIQLWSQNYAADFEMELQQYAPEIIGVLMGHLHSDWLQILTFNNQFEVPQFGVPSISPIFGNRPEFKIYSYQFDTHLLRSFATYYYPMNENMPWHMDYSLLERTRHGLAHLEQDRMLWMSTIA